MTKSAVILLSGGLDSATCLALAKSQGYTCYALSFQYGQRGELAETQAAKRVCDAIGVEQHKIFKIDIGQFRHSALTDTSIDVPTEVSMEDEIPITYVPARNTILLSIALGWAEVLGATDIMYGANHIDYSGYIDCRPEFINAFEQLANLATKAAVEGQHHRILAPLLDMNKSQIIQTGTELGLDCALTVSCYQPDDEGRACACCESCQIRARGFHEAGIEDPTRYA